MRALRKFEAPNVRRFTVLQGGKSAEVRLPLTIKMFASCIAAGFGFVLVQSAPDTDVTTRWIWSVLVSLVSALAYIVYRDITRRIKETEDSIASLDRKTDKQTRMFTHLLTALFPERAAEISNIGEVFYRKDD